MCEYCYRKIALCTSNCNDDPKKKESWKGMEIRVSGKIWKWQKSKTGIKLFWDEIPFKINVKKKTFLVGNQIYLRNVRPTRGYFIWKKKINICYFFWKRSSHLFSENLSLGYVNTEEFFCSCYTVNIIRGAVNKLCLEFICRFCFQPPI